VRIFSNSDQIAQWKKADLADVVCLITNAGYENGVLGIGGFNPTLGLNSQGNPMADASSMIVEGNSFNANFTFSHELGHVLGRSSLYHLIHYPNQMTTGDQRRYLYGNLQHLCLIVFFELYHFPF
jgi:hypothetical protein